MIQIKENFKYIKLVFVLLGFWPKTGKKFWEKFYTFISIFLEMVFIFLVIIESVLTYRDKDPNAFMLAVTFSFASFCEFKALVFLLFQRYFLDIYQFLDDESFQNIPKELEKLFDQPLKLANNIQFGYRISTVLTALFYCLMPIYTKTYVVVPITWTNLDVIPRSFYHIFQCIIISRITASHSTVDLIALNLLSFVKGQLKVLEQKIRFFDPENDKTEDEKMVYLRECAIHHIKIIKVLNLTENLFTFIILVQFLFSVSSVCLIGFQIFSVKLTISNLVSRISYFITLISELGLYCWYGNEIILCSSKILDACYNSNWVNSDIRSRKILKLIMERAKRPLFLTAGKFFVLSLETFTYVIRSAYSFFALLQRMYDGNNEEIK